MLGKAFPVSFTWERVRSLLMMNIIIGLVMVVGGLSGKLALKGTGSGLALAVLGGALMLWGVLRMTVMKPDEE
ncbi:MAG TPA: hypothetical protein VHX44_15150 [Planctomycetota bacterium]|nr:hypothetical protein [Planctomycetota bacterium]